MVRKVNVYVLLWSNGLTSLQDGRPTEGQLDSGFDGSYCTGYTHVGEVYVGTGTYSDRPVLNNPLGKTT